MGDSTTVYYLPPVMVDKRRWYTIFSCIACGRYLGTRHRHPDANDSLDPNLCVCEADGCYDLTSDELWNYFYKARGKGCE